MLFGQDENRLREKRQALTALHSYRSGRVSSIRAPNNGILTLPSNSATELSRPGNNVPVNIYESRGAESLAGAEAAPVSIWSAVQRHEITKENIIKPGPWATVPVKKRVIGKKTELGFTGNYIFGIF